MRIDRVHSHLNGREWILVHEKRIWSEIESVISAIDAEVCKTKVSKEKTKKDRLLYSPTAINQCFKNELRKLKWGEVRTDYWVTDDFELIRKTIIRPLTNGEGGLRRAVYFRHCAKAAQQSVDIGP
jgi:hypothetical protein